MAPPEYRIYIPPRSAEEFTAHVSGIPDAKILNISTTNSELPSNTPGLERLAFTVRTFFDSVDQNLSITEFTAHENQQWGEFLDSLTRPEKRFITRLLRNVRFHYLFQLKAKPSLSQLKKDSESIDWHRLSGIGVQSAYFLSRLFQPREE